MTRRIHLGNLVDVLLVDAPHQMRWLNEHPLITRTLSPSSGLLQQLLNQRTAIDLRFRAGVIPAFTLRPSVARGARQRELAAHFETLQGMPGPETQRLASYVASASDFEIGPTVQQWCGRSFRADYQATSETYRAGDLIAAYPSDFLRAPFWKWTGKLTRARELIDAAAGGDVHCIHATTVAMKNIVKTLPRMRELARSTQTRDLSAGSAVAKCLAAPRVLLRGCRGRLDVPFSKEPLTERTLVLFQLDPMFTTSADLNVAFTAAGWSACPAQRLVTEMLELVWNVAHGRVDAAVEAVTSCRNSATGFVS
jgi:hypothetical protein